MSTISNHRCSSVSRYLREISEYPLLTKKQELAMAQRIPGANGDGRNDTRDHDLVRSNLSFVVRIAKEYRNMGLPFEDLLGEGNIGLIEAAHHFDHTRGTKFITYAVWWIRRSILRALAQHSAMVRVPAYQLRKMRTVRETGNRLTRELGREADREEISRTLRVTIAKIDEILQMKVRELSLDDPIGRGHDAPIASRLADAQSVDPEGELIKREYQRLARAALRNLNDRERTVIVNRFGLAGGREFTLSEIGGRMGISRERVRQIEMEAKTRMRRAIARQQHIAAPPRSRRDEWAPGPHPGSLGRGSPSDAVRFGSGLLPATGRSSCSGSPTGIPPGR